MSALGLPSRERLGVSLGVLGQGLGAEQVLQRVARAESGRWLVKSTCSPSPACSPSKTPALPRNARPGPAVSVFDRLVPPGGDCVPGPPRARPCCVPGMLHLGRTRPPGGPPARLCHSALQRWP